MSKQIPRNIKYNKQFKGKIKEQTNRGNHILYGDFALKSLEKTRLTSEQIEAGRCVITRKMKRLGFVWIRVFPDIPLTAKPIENRMGKGKGDFSCWISKIKKGQILYEISGVSKEDAKIILKICSTKLPIKTKIINK